MPFRSSDSISKFETPVSSYEGYVASVNSAVKSFLDGNLITEALEKGEFAMANYHALLRTIFHQVYFSSTSFSLGGAMSSRLSEPVRAYLMHHAEEEKDHWRWILNDLKATGYSGPDPVREFPNWAAQAYLSYGVFLALFNPFGRLAMAQVLEGISGTFGTKYGMRAAEILKLNKDQMQFFLAHGELDQGHSAEIADVIARESLTPAQWAELGHVAETTAHLYRQLYNFSVSRLSKVP